jgi:cyclohexanone monooxygenase
MTDIEALREKYRQERDKRIRLAGVDQYPVLAGELTRFADDPYVQQSVTREPRLVELDVLIVGAGFGGLQAAVTLHRAGVDDFLMVDVAADFGGVWYWNRFPGIRCDTESYVYLPFLEETGFMPTERYSTGQEIFGYCQLLGRRYDLYRRVLFQTKVTGMQWDQDTRRWVVCTNRGDRLAARFVATQSGLFSTPRLPGVPGIESFQGKAFHAARWDYGYTGGDMSGNMDGLRDKRVGVVGTGSTGLQVIPMVARDAGHLTVFQRTPTAVTARENGPTDPEWYHALPQGWQKQRIESFMQLSCGLDVDCPVDDGWTRYYRHMLAAAQAVPEDQRTKEHLAEVAELADYEWNELVRARVDEFVTNPGAAKTLKAYYRTLCKRPGFSDVYLPAFSQPNVTLVDVSKSDIEKATERGLMVDGVEHELDCLIFATGYEIGTTWAQQAGYDIVGRGAQRLSERWANGAITYHGLFSNGYPNVFFMGLTQTGTTLGITRTLQEQADHLAYVVKRCLDSGWSAVEATVEAEGEWQEAIERCNQRRRPFQEACTPGYYNAEGRPDDRRSAVGSGIFSPATEFFAILADWRAAGNLAGLTVT